MSSKDDSIHAAVIFNNQETKLSTKFLPNYDTNEQDKNNNYGGGDNPLFIHPGFRRGQKNLLEMGRPLLVRVNASALSDHLLQCTRSTINR
jgi:hypothetical protein